MRFGFSEGMVPGRTLLPETESQTVTLRRGARAISPSNQVSLPTHRRLHDQNIAMHEIYAPMTKLVGPLLKEICKQTHGVSRIDIVISKAVSLLIPIYTSGSLSRSIRISVKSFSYQRNGKSSGTFEKMFSSMIKLISFIYLEELFHSQAFINRNH